MPDREEDADPAAQFARSEEPDTCVGCERDVEGYSAKSRTQPLCLACDAEESIRQLDALWDGSPALSVRANELILVVNEFTAQRLKDLRISRRLADIPKLEPVTTAVRFPRGYVDGEP